MYIFPNSCCLVWLTIFYLFVCWWWHWLTWSLHLWFLSLSLSSLFIISVFGLLLSALQHSILFIKRGHFQSSSCKHWIRPTLESNYITPSTLGYNKRKHKGIKTTKKLCPEWIREKKKQRSTVQDGLTLRSFCRLIDLSASWYLDSLM